MSSLKRTADGNEFDFALSSKRAALGISNGDFMAGAHNHLIKILCPNTAIGSIIGRGGAVINLMNQSTGARIKLSQNQDFFPMTDDRVIGITGSLECIAIAIGELVTKIIEVPDKKSSDSDMYGNMTHNQPPSNRALQVRILIPMGASGVMIGRQGAVIKSMSEQSNCHMQLAEMNDPYDTKERIMIINGKNGQLSDLIQGTRLAVAQLFTEPTLCIYSNLRISYGPAGSQQDMDRRPPNMPPGREGREVSHTMGQGMYQQLGYGQLPIMSSYGFDGRGVAQPIITQPYQHSSPQQQHQFSGHSTGYQHQSQDQMRPSAYSSDMLGHGMKGPGSLPSRQQHSYQSQQSNYSSNFSGNQSPLSDVSPPVFTADGASITMSISVPDNLVGAILGRSGCVVKEIMSLSGTQIQISQKDGTQGSGDKYRQVKVVGLQHQVLVAQSMIMAKMQSQPPQGNR